ncbi:MAG: hypothetical protein K9N21_04635 [Deltaproteobacteria bacterium]|nr:hypothetical protein [Deltaproteobacteria bacterium]
MKTRKCVIGLIGVVFLLLNAPMIRANESSVEIQAPNQAVQGSEVVITLRVSHSANNFLHYTDWVSVKVNGEEIARWEYSPMNRPEDEAFTREVKVTVDKDLEVEAQASCNIHGSAGISKRIIFVK